MIRSKEFTFTFVYRDNTGAPITGANLSACISKDNGTLALATNPVTEPFVVSSFPGMYRIVLTATETTADTVTIAIKTASNVAVLCETFQTESSDYALFATPVNSTDATNKASFLNQVADAVLRRSIASAESSSTGDTVSMNSLLGVALININGQEIQCNSTMSECYLPVKTLGGTSLGLIPMRVVGGKIVGNCGCV